MSESQKILKQRLRVKQLDKQWAVLSGRFDLSMEQRVMRRALDKKLHIAKRVLKQMGQEEVERES